MPPDSSKSSESDLESVISQKELRKRCPKEPKYSCTESGCTAKFKRLDALDLHVFKHTGVKKHACTYLNCNKSYRTVTHLKRHLNTTHERLAPTPKTVPCIIPNCKQLFACNTNMQRHVREVHENPKFYKCSYCKETFKQKLKMRRHEISQHTRIYPYNCEKCGKGIYLLFQYERHIATCKVYPCTDCEEVFEKWSLYIKHCREKQHSRKAYKCEYCPNIYRKPSELKEHVGARHVMGEGGAIIYKCREENCGKIYAYERNLKQHMRTSHGDQCFKCVVEDCESEFQSKAELIKHRRQNHKKPSKKVIRTGGSSCKSRKRRKDAGRERLSKLAKLSNLSVDGKFDNLLRDRNEEALKLATDKLAEIISIEETENE